jgi:hypothetical protein
MKRLALRFVVLFAGSLLSASAWADTSVINLGPEEVIKAKGKEIVVPLLSPLGGSTAITKTIAGGWGNPGKIRVYLNVRINHRRLRITTSSNGQDWPSPRRLLGCFPA